MAKADQLRAPRGTFDVRAEDGRARRALLAQAAGQFDLAGYELLETPIFEETELFARGVGESTDIVQKEMFTFEDQGGRSITLRPEGTAGACRAYIEHGMHKLPQPVRCWYSGPFFRYESPQAGRFRQFSQIGAESIGSDDPSVDAELILLLADILAGAGCQGVELRLSSLGTPDTREAYAEELRAHLRAREDELSDEVRRRLDSNPLRAFDSDHEGTQRVLADAPRLVDGLNDEDAAHLGAVRELLDGAGLAYELDGTLVRGLDYYTRTVFEFSSTELGAQSALGGGGRYDGLVEQLGGPPTPAVGWAAGIERILLAAGEPPAPLPPRVYVILDAGADRKAAFGLLRALRNAGVAAQIDQAGRSLKGQLKQADRLDAHFAAIVAADSVSLRDMSTGDQEQLDAGTIVARALAVSP